MAKQSLKKDYIYAVGKRKSASARARVFRGKGENMVNGMSMEKYFPGDILKDAWSKPFRVIDSSDKFYATIRVLGGGKISQVEATAHAIAKALEKIDKDNFRVLLKRSGLLKRDSRERQRRMV